MKKLLSNLKPLSKDQLKQVNGGMRWTSDRGCNVIDLRAGAKPQWMQEISNAWCSLWN